MIKHGSRRNLIPQPYQFNEDNQPTIPITIKFAISFGLYITVTDERNVRQIPLAEVFILLFFICVRDTCKIKSAFILSSGDRTCKGVRLFPNCLQKPRKCAFFLGNMRKKFALLMFCTQSVWGSAAILKLSPGAKICAIFIL